MIPKLYINYGLVKTRTDKSYGYMEGKNPDFEYIRWNEAECIRRKMKFECQERIDEMEEINGKADIMRWEILYKYGGGFWMPIPFVLSQLMTC